MLSVESLCHKHKHSPRMEQETGGGAHLRMLQVTATASPSIVQQSLRSPHFSAVPSTASTTQSWVLLA